MKNLTELSAEWRKANRILSYQKGLDDCADQLDAALPKWTKITDDPETWPKEGQHFMRSEYAKSFEGWSIPESDTFCTETFKYDYVMFVGDMWRPLCSIDYPPKADRGDV